MLSCAPTPTHLVDVRSHTSPAIYQIGQRSGQQNPFDKLETAGRVRLDMQHGRVLWFIAVQRIWASCKTRQARGRRRESEHGEAAGRRIGPRNVANDSSVPVPRTLIRTRV